MLGVIDSVETRRFSVEEYHLMAEAGILGPDERIGSSAASSTR